jgi:hypothetical protein
MAVEQVHDVPISQMNARVYKSTSIQIGPSVPEHVSNGNTCKRRCFSVRKVSRSVPIEVRNRERRSKTQHLKSSTATLCAVRLSVSPRLTRTLQDR